MLFHSIFVCFLPPRGEQWERSGKDADVGAGRAQIANMEWIVFGF